ncbi:MAG: hypothetical protein AAB400_00850 [Patescibacteria group bacterium]
MHDELFNARYLSQSDRLYQDRIAKPVQDTPQSEQLSMACSAIEDALRSLTHALEALKVLQSTHTVQQSTIKEITATQSVLMKETIAATLVDLSPSKDDIRIPEQKIIEGVFNGEAMIDAFGRVYSVPANYASKSKLIEGDSMKLTMSPSGSFIYKQIGPAERQRLIGTLEQSDSRDYSVRIGERRWRVLTASITYYKGVHGDEVIVLVPKSAQSTWAAVENIIKKI